MYVSEKTAKDFLARHGWLSHMPTEMRENILDACSCLNLATGEQLYNVGGPQGAMYGLASGCVAFQAAQSENFIQKGLLMYPGVWFGNGPIAGLDKRLVGASVTRPSTMLVLGFADHAHIASHHPDIWRHHIQLQIGMTARVIGLAQDLMRRGSRERLVAILIRLAGLSDPNPPGSPVIDATQSEIAMIANLSRSMASAHLTQLERDGVVRLGRAMIEILDVHALLNRIQQ